MHGGGAPIAGNGTNKPLRDTGRLSETYGGTPSDWSKVSSGSYDVPHFKNGHTDGRSVKQQVHAYRNTSTGETFEAKTKIVDEEIFE